MENTGKVYCILQCYEDTSIVIGVIDSKVELDEIMEAINVVQEKYIARHDCIMRQAGVNPDMQWWEGKFRVDCLEGTNLFTEEESAFLGWLDNGEFVKNFYRYTRDCFEATENVVFHRSNR